MEATKLINGAILGFDGEPVTVNDKVYIINPPTIARIAGAAYWLSDLDGSNNLIESLKSIESASKALSWLIKGDDSLSDELSNGTLEEVTTALEAAYTLISAENFIKLSTLARNVGRLTANPRPKL